MKIDLSETGGVFNFLFFIAFLESTESYLSDKKRIFWF